MVASKKVVEANREYNKQHYERIEFTVRKGDKEKIKKHVAKYYPGKSVNYFIRQKLKEEISSLRE